MKYKKDDSIPRPRERTPKRIWHLSLLYVMYMNHLTNQTIESCILYMTEHMSSFYWLLKSDIFYQKMTAEKKGLLLETKVKKWNDSHYLYNLLINK